MQIMVDASRMQNRKLTETMLMLYAAVVSLNFTHIINLDAASKD